MMVDATRLIALGVPAPLAKELAAQMESVGSDADVTFANVSVLSGDWRGTGAEQLTAALTDLETRLAALESA